MNILVVRFDTPLTGDERVAIREGSVDKFRALPGLEEKYYLGALDEPGAGGIYLFDTTENLQAYLDGPIVRGIEGRYLTPAPPQKQILDVLEQVDLRGIEPDATRRQIGIVLMSEPGEPPALTQDFSAYAETSGLQRLFVVTDEQTGRGGVLGLWGDAVDLGVELRSEAFAGLAGIEGPAEYEVFEVPRVLREEP